MRRAAFFIVLLAPLFTFAQRAVYPQGYFRNPLNIPILLAGNFGECRPGHFHSGMDVKTGGHENEPVYAAADGYISRIKMEPGGFGHGLYITHPNGYTTLYAHLNDFVPAIQQYVRREQYAKESWTVDLSFQPDQFPVKKGDQIAWSGNTGGSTAPHLHFEIRDGKTEHPLNPQLFGFAIKDDVPPLPKQLVLYDIAAGSMNMVVPDMHPLRKSGDGYKPEKKDSITVFYNDIGIGIVADDYMPGSDNTLAFYTAEWYVDDTLQGRIRLDDIGYDETRYVDAYADYYTKWQKGPWVQCLFRQPGNRLERIYESLNAQRGLIRLKASYDVYHPVRVVLTDVYGNASDLRFSLRYIEQPTALSCTDPALPGKTKSFNTPAASFYLDETSLYDKACIKMIATPDKASLSPRVIIAPRWVALHHYFELSLKPDKPIPFSLRSKIVMINYDSKTETGKAAKPAQQGAYAASFRDFGEFRLAADTIAPVLKPLVAIKGNMAAAKSIAFRATDNLTSVKTFRGELDGKWILFEQHEDTWTYVFDAHCPKGKHTLLVKAIDENGNEAKASYTFTR